MFNNSSNINASHSTFSEVHRDQYYTSHSTVQGNQSVHTIIHGNQIFQGSQIGLEALQKASAPSATFDSVERDPAPRCLEGTRVQLLDRLTRWMEDESEHYKPVCWVNGRPGSGKSAVSQTVAETYATQKRLAASFFFSRRDIQRRTTRHFFPTLAAQFLSSFPSIRPAVLAALEQDPMIPSKLLREQVQKLLLDPLSSVDPPRLPLLIIVDALDECDDPRLVLELVLLMVQLVRASPVPLRLLITSRTESWLQAHFHHSDISTVTVPIDIHSFAAEDDIRSFLKHALNDVYNEHPEVMQSVPLPWPCEQDLDRILQKASGLFIFALTVAKFVGDRLHNPIERLKAILEDKPSRETYGDLDSLYLDTVSVFPDPDMVRLILGIVYCMSVPMSVPALHKLLDRPDVDARIVIPALGSVLVSSQNGEQPIQFYHASFRDFLISPQRSRKYTIDPVIYHRLMAQLCFKTMLKSLSRNMCRINDPTKMNREIEDFQERRQTAYDEALLYACRYWEHHLTQVPPKGGVYDSLLGSMQEFCTRKILYWIETASIFDDVDKAIMMLRSALTWVKSLAEVPQETATLLEDAERLVLLFRIPISQSAPHVYHTAITFAPSTSALYANFKHEAGNSFIINQNQDDSWMAYQYAIDLESVTSVAFSPTGDVLATAGTSQGVQLWNVVTGGNIASLGDRAASALLVRFSRSGAFVSAAFADGMVSVWDPALGRECLKDTGVHKEQITSLEFSPDSMILASGARDNTIQLWSLRTTQRLYRLAAHEGPVTALAFTPDSRRLCSGGEDHLLILWDVGTGRVVRGMMGHRGTIATLDVSRDGSMIATGSDDKSVKIWQAQTGKCTRTLAKRHKNPIHSVHFYDEDKKLLSTSNGIILSSLVSSKSSSDVSLWDRTTHLQAAMVNAPLWQAKFLAHGLPSFLMKKMAESVYGGASVLVAYSLHSSSFAFSFASGAWSGSFDPIFNTPPLHSSQDFHTALALSPDGSRVASATLVGSIDILDATVPRKKWDEEMKRDLSVPLLSAQTIVSSPNGERFIVNSGLSWYLADKFFHLLTKIDFGVAEYARDDDVPRPAFSADSSIFAWSLSDFLERQRKTSVRVYESTSGTQIGRFTGLKKVKAFVVSPVGRLVGCGHEGGITVCDVDSHTKRAMDVAADATITALEFSADACTLLSGSMKGVVQLWDTSSGVCQATLSVEGVDSAATGVAFAPSGDMGVVAHEDGTVRLFSLSTKASHAICPADHKFTKSVRCFKFSDDGSTLTCRTDENVVTVWKIPPRLFSPRAAEGESSEKGVVSCTICTTRGDEATKDAIPPTDSTASADAVPLQDSTLPTNSIPPRDVVATDTVPSSDTIPPVDATPSPDVNPDADATPTSDALPPTDTSTALSPPADVPPSKDVAQTSGNTPPLQHLLSTSDKANTFDCMFRSSYVVRRDGWVCKDDKRLFWLPQHLRPLHSDTQFAALNNRIMILTHNRQVLFLTLTDGL